MTANASMHATRGKQGPSMATPSRGPGSLCNNPYLLLKRMDSVFSRSREMPCLSKLSK